MGWDSKAAEAARRAPMPRFRSLAALSVACALVMALDSAAAQAPTKPALTAPSPAADTGSAPSDLRMLGQGALKLAVERLRASQDDILAKMGERAIDRAFRDTQDVRLYIGLVPLSALVIVPLWLWRRRSLARARERGVGSGRAMWRATAATLLVTVMLWGFVQIFLYVEDFKRYFAWSSPAQGLATNALVYLGEKGEKVAKEGTQLGNLLGASLHAVVDGKQTPETLFGHLFENARRLQDTWAFRFGYRIYTVVFPWLDYFGPILLVVMLLVFLRFALPGIREMLDHVSGDGPSGRGFLRSLFRYLRVELFAMTLFLFPYILVIIVSAVVTLLMTESAARGIVDSTFNALTLFYKGTVSPELVIADFLGIILFVFETVAVLLVVTAILLSNWVRMLHEKFLTGGSFWSYRRFIPHFFRSMLRLYASLLVPAIGLGMGLDWLADQHQELGPTVTMLLPLMLFAGLNVLLVAVRFWPGVRRALDTSRWLPTPATAPVFGASKSG